MYSGNVKTKMIIRWTPSAGGTKAEATWYVLVETDTKPQHNFFSMHRRKKVTISDPPITIGIASPIARVLVCVNAFLFFFPGCTGGTAFPVYCSVNMTLGRIQAMITVPNRVRR